MVPPTRLRAGDADQTVAGLRRKEMSFLVSRRDLTRLTGNLQQVASARAVRFREGWAADLDGYIVRNGPLCFDVLAGKCLDIGDLSYKGINLSFLAKPGLMGRTSFDTQGVDSLRSINCGLLFTAGLGNVASPCELDGDHQPMHGRLRTTPADHVGGDARWEGDDYVIRIHGEMRESRIFGENLALRREIETRLGSSDIIIRDTVTNEGFRPEPIMLLYHCNFGYPLLSESARVVIPSLGVTPRNDESAAHLADWGRAEAPRPGALEWVYTHRVSGDAEGRSFAALINDEMGLGVSVDFDVRLLPNLVQWKSMVAGDYVMGLEPTNAGLNGRAHHVPRNEVKLLAAESSETYELRIAVFEGETAIKAAEMRAARLVAA